MGDLRLRPSSRVVRVTPVEVKSPARDHAADLVVAHAARLAAEFVRMLAERPREVVHQLDRRVVVDEWRVALFAESVKAGDADVGYAPIERVVARQVDAEILDHIDGVGSRRDVRVHQTAPRTGCR